MNKINITTIDIFIIIILGILGGVSIYLYLNNIIGEIFLTNMIWVLMFIIMFWCWFGRNLTSGLK
jgi:hypothetical protein